MGRLALSFAAVTVGTALASAQELATTYSNPKLPAREVLDRLNLKMEWSARIPMETRRDGIFSVQLLETDLVRTSKKNGLELVPQIAVQTRSGLVVLLHRETGEVMWKARVGRPYPALQLLAFNSRTIFQAQGLSLYAFDRTDGSLQWQNDLPAGLATAPVADESQIYFETADGRVRVYLVPDLDRYRAAKAAEGTGPKQPDIVGGRRDPLYSGYGTPTPSLSIGTETARTLNRTVREGPQLLPIWDTIDIYHGGGVPFLAGANWIIPGATGTLFAMARGEPKESMKFRAGGGLLLPPGTFGSMAYVAAQNATLYAVNTETGELFWDYTTGTAFRQRPVVTEDDVYVATERFGLQRLDRITGERRWKTPARDAERVLAANPKFVYAQDRSNRLLVLDRARGTELSRWDDRDFSVPIVNEHTDRLLLAAHDGLIVCLHDKEYVQPMLVKNSPRDDGGKFNPIYDRLTNNITMKEPLDKQPLRNALDYFAEGFGLPVTVQPEAFRSPAEMEAFLNQPVSLVKVESAPLGEVLNQLLHQIKAKYVVRPGYLQLLPDKNAKNK